MNELVTSRLAIAQDRMTHIRDYIIGPTDGTRVIPKASDVFTGGIGKAYDNYEGTGHPTRSTKEIKVALYSVSKKEELRDILESRGVLLQDMAFTEHQVIRMIEDHGHSLDLNRQSVFFLARVGEEYYIHQVRELVSGEPKISSVDYYLQKIECQEGFEMCLVVPN